MDCPKVSKYISSKLHSFITISESSKKILKSEVDEFIKSSTASEISDVVLELEEYIKGGRDSDHKQLREAYGHISKPQARKIRNYLYSILEDAWRYSSDRRPGRRKKQSK